MAFNFDRTLVKNCTPSRSYTQEFATVLWVETGGNGVYHVNGQRLAMTPGTLVLQRPADRVQIVAVPGPAELIISRGLIRRATLEFMRARYFPTSTTFFWKPTIRPFSVQLNAAQREWLASWTRALYDFQYNQMMIDLFLLGLFSQLQPGGPAVSPNVPTWLQQALEAVHEPQHFRTGAAGFVRLAGRSLKHVNRVLRQYYRLTATAVVNRARMEYAAHELMASDKKITDICDECGFQNLGHFYRLFEQYHKTTPRRYRHGHHLLTPDSAQPSAAPGS